MTLSRLVLFPRSFEDDNDLAVPWLKILEFAFVWEVRMLYLVPIIVSMLLASNVVGYAIAALSGCFLFFFDSVVSVLVTILFLHPIVKTLGEATPTVLQECKGYRHMQRTKWMTVFGAVLSVSSSTLLYTMGILLTTNSWDSIYWTSPWLNVIVFPINADSMLNDIGMLLLSGMTHSVLLKVWPSPAMAELELVNTAGEPIINSRAYEETHDTGPV